ncbi:MULTISPECIES: hypothetical protein [unclassified Fusobacterium]|uniref:hypothetical protein n=1 Tax=unclassified Fusobacterium TaxID=2648384 RepID=UPI001B8BDCD8|nr:MULTISPECIES: hypothetical protein [unclassified Fusobacterium]MBR8701034.1 hypothetical protein [Fusobacterium sp. DD45]MBR8710806.1 hypothetical protein [Fusobacterium sp. DD28]MBR8751416.1 hypothetical protein [Fusobacterium sp. DD26]
MNKLKNNYIINENKKMLKSSKNVFLNQLKIYNTFFSLKEKLSFFIIFIFYFPTRYLMNCKYYNILFFIFTLCVVYYFYFKKKLLVGYNLALQILFKIILLTVLYDIIYKIIVFLSKV